MTIETPCFSRISVSVHQNTEIDIKLHKDPHMNSGESDPPTKVKKKKKKPKLDEVRSCNCSDDDNNTMPLFNLQQINYKVRSKGMASPSFSLT